MNVNGISMHQQVLPLALLLPGLAFMLLVTGCATTHPLPAAEVSAARIAVSAAEAAGADLHAPAELESALRKLEQAQQAVDAGAHLEARMLAEQAEVDARLAEAIAHANRQQEATDALHATIESLRQELERIPGAAAEQDPDEQEAPTPQTAVPDAEP